MPIPRGVLLLVRISRMCSSSWELREKSGAGHRAALRGRRNRGGGAGTVRDRRQPVERDRRSPGCDTGRSTSCAPRSSHTLPRGQARWRGCPSRRRAAVLRTTAHALFSPSSALRLIVSSARVGGNAARSAPVFAAQSATSSRGQKRCAFWPSFSCGGPLLHWATVMRVAGKREPALRSPGGTDDL